MTRFPILDVCARIEGHGLQHKLLNEHCLNFTAWKELLILAEKEGMAPLLKKHLDESESIYPISVRRSLNILYKRHQHEAEVRFGVLQEILVHLYQKGLNPLVIKGAALCHTTYSDADLRPMRDIDLLFRKNEVDRAQKIMQESGFKQSKAPIPQNHHHLPSLHKTVEDVDICFELHRDLYPNCPPYYPEVDFEKLLKRAKLFKIGEVDARTSSDEETLHYIYQHSLRAPLTYEPFKLINAADIIGFTEKHCSRINFDYIKRKYPLLHQVLPLMHHISPWDSDKIPESLADTEYGKARSPNPFKGWPQKRLKEFKAEGNRLPHIILNTFLPSSWWIATYYGATSVYESLICYLWRHPKHVYWWVKLMWSMNRRDNSNAGL